MTTHRQLIRLTIVLAIVCHACAEPPPAVEENPSGEDHESSLAEAQRIVDNGSAPSLERAQAHRRLGQNQSHQGLHQDAIVSLEAAAELFESQPADVARTLNLLSDVLLDLGHFERQEAVLWQALEIAAELDDHNLAADSWNNLGVCYASSGQPSAALEAYHRSLELGQGLNAPRAAATRHNLGVQLLQLGRIDEGVDELRRAIATRRQLGDTVAVGATLASLAWGLTLDDQPQAAFDAYAESIELLTAGQDIQDLAVALEQRAQLYRSLGRFDEARTDLQRSRELLTSAGEAPPLDAAYIDLGLGAIQREQADPEETRDVANAIAQLRRSVQAFDTLNAQEGRVLVRLELARALRLRDDGREEATHQLETALEIIEAARSDLHLPAFRATFLGTWQAIHQELVDILATASLGPQALAVAERARARSLLDRMAAQPADEPESSRGLRQKVEALEAQAILEPTDDHRRGMANVATQDAGERRAALQRMRLALEQSQEIERREGPPSPAATPASVETIRRQLDADTVLLVYALAPERSWLWRVDSEGVEVINLPPGPEIEAAARKAHQLLPVHHRRGYGKAARQALTLLSRLVLAPVADNLGASRLAIVPDGALHLVPFGALPIPGDNTESPAPLVTSHEVVHLPSASTLVALRQRARRKPASQLLAIVADPVFEADDSRLTGRTPAIGDSPDLARTRSAVGGHFGRLVASAEEGSRIAAIAERVTGISPSIYRDFDASRELVTSGGLGDVRILHFATHGVVDAEDPALAGLVLSLFDAEGQRQDGLLRARDLHRLRLAADLVVLSACRTALGEEIRGEGLVGLADGFFAAGANQLIVSLWDVEDRPTAELMVRFYRHLLVAGRGPADALRHAQLELRDETEWRSPAYWAGFVVVGNWKVDEIALKLSI